MEETTRNWLVCILFAVLLVGALGFAMHKGWITVDFQTATATPSHD